MRNNVIIKKMIRYTDKILSYCQNLDYDAFCGNDMLVEACVFNLSQLGELTAKLDEDFKRQNKNISWHQIYGLRNRIVHDYDGVNLRLIWEIISADLPKLRKDLTVLVKSDLLTKHDE